MRVRDLTGVTIPVWTEENVANDQNTLQVVWVRGGGRVVHKH